jgi:hypothetical protein
MRNMYDVNYVIHTLLRIVSYNTASLVQSKQNEASFV